MAAGPRHDESLDGPSRTDLYHGLFRWYAGRNGRPAVLPAERGPRGLRMAYACPECRELVWLSGL